MTTEKHQLNPEEINGTLSNAAKSSPEMQNGHKLDANHVHQRNCSNSFGSTGSDYVETATASSRPSHGTYLSTW